MVNKYVNYCFYIIILIVMVGCTKKSRESTSILPDDFSWQKVAGNLEFPEGPAWNGENSIYLSDCYGGWIAKYKDGKIDTFLAAGKKTFQKTNGLAFDPDGYLYACEYGIGQILKISMEGNVEKYVTEYQNDHFNRPNDLAFDKQGHLYFTDPKAYGTDKLDGRIFCIKRNNREVVLVEDSLAFPNGIAFSVNYKELYVCESAFNRIVRYKVGQDGLLENKETFIELPGGDPDGIAFDKQGNLYVAHFGGGHVYVISPDGKIIEKIKTPGKKPTNLEFGGQDMKTLYLTEVETGGLYRAQVNIAGVSLINK
jgi:gluconolactonase